MKDSIPKLHSVKLKTGGARLRVLHNMKPSETCDRLQRDIDRIKEVRKDDMAGYAIVAWSDNGANSAQVFTRNTRWLNSREVPDFVRSSLHDLCWDN